MAPRPKKGWIHFRTDGDLDEQLDQMADDLRADGVRASRSSVARDLLRQALQSPEQSRIAQESAKEIYGLTQKVTNRAVSEVLERLPDLIDEELGLVES